MLRRLLFGRRCALCREPMGLKIPEHARICQTCAKEVRQSYRCTHSKAVACCARSDAALLYKDQVRRAMVRVKFYHNTNALHWFAEQTTARLLANLDDWKPDLVTFVPTSPLRKWMRGYNQSEVLARRAAERCGLPCADCLRRRPFGKRQSRMSSDQERRRNAAHAFLPRDGVRLDGKRVVLVDDILTTGATAEVCARLLLHLGASEVCLLTATRVP